MDCKGLSSDEALPLHRVCVYQKRPEAIQNAVGGECLGVQGVGFSFNPNTFIHLTLLLFILPETMSQRRRVSVVQLGKTSITAVLINQNVVSSLQCSCSPSPGQRI